MATVTLDPDQALAVAHGQGPCLVLAGPGSGKTRVIVERFLSLIERGTPPERLLVLTYTSKAAQEMRQRVETALATSVGDVPLATYHAFSQRVVRDWGWLVGVGAGFHIADRAEMWLHVEAILGELRPPSLWNPLRPHDLIDSLIHVMGAAKLELVTPEQYLAHAQTAQSAATNELEQAQAARDREIAEVYQALEQRCRRLAVFDHDDTILLANRLLRESEAARRAVVDQLDFVMVDEFQDTNFAQAQLVETLVDPRRNLLVVADDDQAIYKFRGASLANLQGFTRDYPDHARVTLSRNYRSTPPIVAMARHIIGAAAPESRLDKTITAVRDGGTPVEVWVAPDERAEAESVAADCARMIAEGTDPADIAWLFRQHSDMAAAMAALTAAEVPFIVKGGRGFFQRREIKDALALLAAIADPLDSQALLRCLHLPSWRVSPAGRLALVASCRDNDTPVLEAVRAGSIANLTDEDATGLTRCVDAVVALHATAEREDVRDLLFAAIEESGFLGLLDQADPAERRDAGANLNRLGELLESFADWCDDRRVVTALHYLSVLRDCGAADELADSGSTAAGVALLTAHSAKGLEWPVVFISRCTDERWPGRPQSPGRMQLPDALVPEPPPVGDDNVDEERRLIYVAATRAQNRLVLTHALRYPRTYSDQHRTRFLNQLGDESLDVLHRDLPPSSAGPAVRRRTRRQAPQERLQASISGLKTFKDCPRRYEYRWRYRLPTRRSVLAWYGTLMHGVLEDAARQRIAGTAPTIDEVVAGWHAHWQASTGPRGSHAEMRELGESQLRRYLATPAWAAATIRDVERSFSLPTTAASVNGRFDRIDMRGDNAVIVDYKTGPPREAARLSSDLQVRGYAVALTQAETRSHVTVELHYLQNAEVVAVELDDRTLDRAFKHLSASTAELREAWSTGSFPPRPSQWQCGRCDYRMICDEGRDATNP